MLRIMMGKITPRHIRFPDSPYFRSMTSKTSGRYQRTDESSTKRKVEAFFKQIKENQDTAIPSIRESRELQNKIIMLPTLEASFSLVLTAPFRPDSFIYYSLLKKTTVDELKDFVSAIPKGEVNSYHFAEAIRRACFTNNWPLAKHFFYVAQKREVANTVIYNMMLKSASQMGDYPFTKSLFKEMPEEKKDSVTYGTVIDLAGYHGDNAYALEVVKSMPSSKKNDVVYHVLLDCLVRAGMFTEAQHYYNESKIGKEISLVEVRGYDLLGLDLHGNSHGSGFMMIREFIRSYKDTFHFLPVIVGKGREEKGNFLAFRRELADLVRKHLPEFQSDYDHRNRGVLVISRKSG